MVPQKTGIGWAIVQEVLPVTPPATAPYLSLGEVDRRLASIAELRGAGSAKARKDQLGALFALATAAEQQFLATLIVGEVRQGALDGVVVEAIAKAAELPADVVRRAYMFAGDLGEVAATALDGGAAEIGRFGLALFRPVLPMLAQTADDAEPRSRASAARRRSRSSSMGFACRSTRSATTCGCTRAGSTTCRRSRRSSSPRRARCRRAG